MDYSLWSLGTFSSESRVLKSTLHIIHLSFLLFYLITLTRFNFENPDSKPLNKFTKANHKLGFSQYGKMVNMSNVLWGHTHQDDIHIKILKMKGLLERKGTKIEFTARKWKVIINISTLILGRIPYLKEFLTIPLYLHQLKCTSIFLDEVSLLDTSSFRFRPSILQINA